jgi:hypothetical protein
MKRKPFVRVVDVLPIQPGLPAKAPKLEFEPIHKRVARLAAEQERLTKEIQSHKLAWADRNRVAQDTHQPPSTPEIQAFKQHHRELSCALADVNLKIGEANRELRVSKAAGQGNGSKQPAVLAPEPKRTPFANDLEFDVYFRLAAHNELAPALYAQIERCAKSMIADARRMGVE